MKIATKCFITKSSSGINDVCEKDGWKEVGVRSNDILQKIMKSYDSWNTGPIIFVGNNYRYVYKIMTIVNTETHAILYQICLRFDTREKTYSFVNKRKVVIWFV